MKFLYKTSNIYIYIYIYVCVCVCVCVCLRISVCSLHTKQCLKSEVTKYILELNFEIMYDTTNVVIQQNSRKLLMINILMSETF